MWKIPLVALVTVLLTACIQNKPKDTVYPPLIVADVTPIVSATKKSIGVRVNFENIAHADYSYARFKITAFNSNGQVIKPKKGARQSAYVRLAGPIAPGQIRSTTWANTWKNRDVQCISLDEVELIFPSGRVETAMGNRLLSKQEGHTCI